MLVLYVFSRLFSSAILLLDDSMTAMHNLLLISFTLHRRAGFCIFSRPFKILELLWKLHYRRPQLKQ